MKCQNCGINYDDSEKICPMCGAVKPIFAKDKSKLSKQNAKPAGEYKPNKEIKDAMSSMFDLGQKTNNKKHSKKLNNKIGTIVALIIMLLSFLPAIISFLMNLL